MQKCKGDFLKRHRGLLAIYNVSRKAELQMSANACETKGLREGAIIFFFNRLYF